MQVKAHPSWASLIVGSIITVVGVAVSSTVLIVGGLAVFVALPIAVFGVRDRLRGSQH